jgi:hypothetical protein
MNIMAVEGVSKVLKRKEARKKRLSSTQCPDGRQLTLRGAACGWRVRYYALKPV